MTPSPGRIVLYTMTAQDAEQVNRCRHDFITFTAIHKDNGFDPGETGHTGHVGHVGNEVREDDVFPAVVVRTWHGYDGINLKVMLDGNDDYWATSRTEGDGAGEWHWPVIA